MADHHPQVTTTQPASRDASRRRPTLPTTNSGPDLVVCDDAATLPASNPGRSGPSEVLGVPLTLSRSTVTVSGSRTHSRPAGVYPDASFELPASEPALGDRAAAGPPSPAGGQSATGLPLPEPHRGRHFTTTTRYAVTSCDRQGRLADRSPVRAMRWPPRQPIAMVAGHHTIVVRATADGLQTITPQGFLHLPAAIRHRCRIHTGDRLLVAAYPDQDLILLCTLAVLDELLTARIGSGP